MTMRCLFGHGKRFVAIKDCRWYSIFDTYTDGQLARWICDRCGKMGQKFLPRDKGIWTIHFGRLVPDEKRWASNP